MTTSQHCCYLGVSVVSVGAVLPAATGGFTCNLGSLEVDSVKVEEDRRLPSPKIVALFVINLTALTALAKNQLSAAKTARNNWREVSEGDARPPHPHPPASFALTLSSRLEVKGHGAVGLQ